ncbi:UNVERIFIED_CONTAM: hypothetical protein NCL1_56349 [Trichonephila clavipes]
MKEDSGVNCLSVGVDPKFDHFAAGVWELAIGIKNGRVKLMCIRITKQETKCGDQLCELGESDVL